MKKNTLYAVMMYKYGDIKMPAYLLGVFSRKTKAKKAMLAEQERRGGEKYLGEITETTIDGRIGKIIHEVKYASYWSRDKSYAAYTNEPR